MSTQSTHKSSCFCGEVQFEVSGDPAAMGYCHCASCRQWSAGPVNAFTLWPPAALKVTRGAGSIGVRSTWPEIVPRAASMSASAILARCSLIARIL